MIYNKVNERLTQTIYLSSTKWRNKKLSVLEMKYFVIIVASTMDASTVPLARAPELQVDSTWRVTAYITYNLPFSSKFTWSAGQVWSSALHEGYGGFAEWKKEKSGPRHRALQINERLLKRGSEWAVFPLGVRKGFNYNKF